MLQGTAGKIILEGLESFFEPITKVAKVTFGGTDYDNLALNCLDTKVSSLLLSFFQWFVVWFSIQP